MIWQNPKHLTDELVKAGQTFDEQRAAELCDELIVDARRKDEPFPVEHAKRALEILRAGRMFPLMERLADVFIQNGQTHPQIRRQYAQALLDQGRLSSAILVLEKLASDTACRGRDENAEARGLLGRAYKQMYVDGHGESPERGARTLYQAFRYYYDVYQRAPARYLWHGVNAAALLLRAKKDGVRLKCVPNASALAERVMELAKSAHLRLRVDDPNRRWNSATALEAAIGLDRADEVQHWLECYLRSDGLTAFELSSTYRQLVEVWGLEPTSAPGAKILPLMEAKLLQCFGAGLEVKPLGVSERSRGLQNILGDTSYVKFDWYRRGLDRCARVARVETEFDQDQGFGTGFLIRGTDLSESLGDKEYVMTNAHVVSVGVRGALRPTQARVSFKAIPSAVGMRWNVHSVVRESPPDKLDFAILELDSAVDGAAPHYPLAAARPKKDEVARVYVIGHPQGGTLSLSLNDNRLLDFDDRMLHYRAPTEGGSSGSPVFNQDWELLGLHHSGGKDTPRLHDKPGRYAANEGVWIDAIRKALV